MKKKGPRAIPEFGRGPKREKGDPAPDAATQKRAAPATPRPIVRPSTTPSKLGRRGG